MNTAITAPPPPPPTDLGKPRVLAPSASIKVSPLCLGGMSIGNQWADAMGQITKEEAFELLDAFVEAGGNFIDTSNNYQNQESEIWIGEWMQARGNRDSLVIATKYTTNYVAAAAADKNIHTVNHGGNHKRSLRMSVRDSLRKLQTDWIDILYLHWWDHLTSIEEVVDSLHTIVQHGSVLYLGISDSPAWVVAAANTYARAHGKTPFAVYQGRWNVLVRDFEREIIPVARHFGMALVPWDVVGSGKWQSRRALEERRRGGEPIRSNMGGRTEADERMSEALEKVAGELGVESVTAVAIAYVRQKAQHVIPLVGGRKARHLRDNIQALKLRLSDEQMAYLEGVSPLAAGFPYDIIGEDPRAPGATNPMVSLQLFDTEIDHFGRPLA